MIRKNQISWQIKIIVAFLAIGLGVLFGFLTMRMPSPVPPSAGGVSAYNMQAHLNVIAAEKRSELHPERRLYVRDYIIGVMQGFGLEAEIYDFTLEVETWSSYMHNLFTYIHGTTGDFYFTNYHDWQHDLAGTHFEGSNLLFRQQGASDTAIMLIAHYDSVALPGNLNPNFMSISYGAADAGYGVSAMLEVARYFAGKELENTIYFLFTDLHEIGLWGAFDAINTIDFSNVSMILNLEARGIRGPVHMFETPPNNLEVMRFYRDALSMRSVQPMSYSIAAAIFYMMPNGSDLTLFLRDGFTGMNFASLDNVRYYHTYRDSLDFISLTTMQHYAEKITALVYTFATNAEFSNPEIFNSSQTGVFFPLPFNIFVLYSENVALILGIIAVMVVLFAYFVFRDDICIKKVLAWAGVLILSIILAAGVGLLASFVISLITGDAFNIVYMPTAPEMPIMLILTACALNAFVILHLIFKNKFSATEMGLAGVTLLVVATISLQFIMVEATFLTLIPLIATLPLIISKFNDKLSLVFTFIAVVLTITLLIPVIISFIIALTVGALAITLALSILMCMALPPLFISSNN